MTIRRALAVLIAAAVLWPTAATAKPLPENDSSAKPTDHAGYFLGYPSPTYSWHGCTKTSTQDTPTELDAGVPGAGPGNKQKKVTWTVTESDADAGYTVKWKVAKGWKICGAQIALLGRKADADADFAMSAAYTSKVARGSTVTSGKETILVKISKKDCQQLGIDKKYAGKWSIQKIYDITVFIKKKK